jgi:hypothetical protein
VTVDIPGLNGPRKPRPATLALRRARRGAGVRVSPGTEEAVVQIGGQALARFGPETGHEKVGVPAAVSGIAPRRTESGQGIGPRRMDPWAGRLARVRATLARAKRLQDWIDAAPGRNKAEAARMEGVTRARVSQLFLLLKLVREIKADIERPGRTGKVPSEAELRQIALLDRSVQYERYRAMLGLDEPHDGRAERRAAKTQARNRGLQCHLARARELQALLETGRFASMADLARYAGMSGPRASQLLDLLGLHPEILAAIDRGEADHVSERNLRLVTRLQDPDDQLFRWSEMCSTQ